MAANEFSNLPILVLFLIRNNKSNGEEWDVCASCTIKRSPNLCHSWYYRYVRDTHTNKGHGHSCFVQSFV